MLEVIQEDNLTPLALNPGIGRFPGTILDLQPFNYELQPSRQPDIHHFDGNYIHHMVDALFSVICDAYRCLGRVALSDKVFPLFQSIQPEVVANPVLTGVSRVMEKRTR